MRAELKHMQHALGITTIYVTHDQIEAMTLAHRVALLEGGRLQQLDTPANIYNNPANLFVAQFIGSPPMNVVKGSLDGKNFIMPGSKIATPVGGKIAAAVLGVRPEDCSVVAPAKGAIKGEIYAIELIGDHTLVTVKAGSDMLTVKAAKDFTAKLGEKSGVAFGTDRLFVFDESTGLRVR
jgi:multiple sugar transport system ATP-binding protein